MTNAPDWLRRHLVAALSVGGALLVWLALDRWPGDRPDLLWLLLGAVVVSAFHGGLAPGVAATALSIAAAYAFSPSELGHAAHAAAFVADAVLVSAVGAHAKTAAARVADWRAATAQAESHLHQKEAQLRALIETEERLRESEMRLRRLTESNVIGIAFADRDRIHEANDAFLAMIGYERHEVIGGTVNRHTVTPPEYQETDERGMAELARTGRCPPYEKEYVHKDGRRVPVLIGAVSTHEQPLRWVTFVLDLSAQKRVEHQLQEALGREREARAEVEQASRAKDEFLALVSHELRSPLNAVTIWARLLRQRTLEPEATKRALEAIERSVGLQVRLIEDLLDGSRIVSGKLVMDMRTVDLAAAARASVEVIRPAYDEKGVALDVDVDAMPIPVAGDPGRLGQVLNNLLSNACKFTPAGGRASIRVQRIGLHAKITVRDTGSGIPASVLPHIFEPFRQADSSITRRHGGLGLGLAIARYIVYAHGGTITAESEGENRGATFMVRVPIDLKLADAAPPPGVEKPLDTASLDGLRVLVVDDERDARESVAAVLSRSGADVDSADSARAALERVQDRRPDVLVTDLAMPEQDGFWLLQGLRAMGSGRIPVIALTALAGPEDRVRVKDAGFDLHLTKPIDPDELLAAVESAARGTERDFAQNRAEDSG